MSLTKVTYAMIESDPINVLDYGAVGDGIVDDTAALQAAVNYGFANQKPVYLPNGTYKTTKPILVYGNSVPLSPVSGSILIGESRESTIIKKYGSANAGTGFSYDTNSVIIIANASAYSGVESTGAAKWVTLQNLYLMGNSNDVANIVHVARNASDITLSYMRFESFTNAGLYVTANFFMSRVILIYILASNGVSAGNYGVYYASGIGTSTIYENMYVIGTLLIAYKITGTYQTMISCAADACQQTVYDLSSFRGTLVSPGSESTDAEIQVLVGQFGNVSLINPDLIGNFTSATATQISVTLGGKLQIFGGRVGYDGTETGLVAPGYLYKVANFATMSTYDVTEGDYTLDGIVAGAAVSTQNAITRNGVNQRTGTVTVAANATTTITVTSGDPQGPITIDFSTFSTAAAGSVMVKAIAAGYLPSTGAPNVSKIIDSASNGSLSVGTITKVAYGFSFPIVNSSLTATAIVNWVATGIFSTISVTSA